MCDAKLHGTLQLGLAAALLAACRPDAPVAPLDLTASGAGMGAEPPVIWLHYDYLVAPDHSHEPLAASIDSVVSAFRRRGITLHIDPKHAAIPETDDNRHIYLGWGRANIVGCNLEQTTATGMLDLRGRYFKPRGTQPWHYTVIGHSVSGSRHGECIGGEAELLGYNFTMGNGLAFDQPEQADTRLRVEAGLLMHELGHNLGLHHGGPWYDAQAWKPNYISVMNYAYGYGISYAASTGSNVKAGVRFDYSDRILPLDEAHLDERVGVQAGTRDIISYLCLPPGRSEPDFVEGFGAAAGPIDWNCNGVIEPVVAHDIDVNFDPEYGSSCTSLYPCYTVLRGFNDWSYLHELLRTPAYRSGTLQKRGIVP